MNYKIGTRGSKLALIQTEWVKNRMQERFPEDTYEIVIIRTKGDRIQDKPLEALGGSGLFVKEIECELLSGEIDLAVHSMKDMPAKLPEGLCFAPVWEREDPRDALILREKKSLEELPKQAVIATGSSRRACQIQKLRPDIQIVDIRGNVDTRLEKMHAQKLDGLILAAAGLHRLGKSGHITQYFDTNEMIPAPTQGTLAIELREADAELREKLAVFADEGNVLCTEAEREFLREMDADCHLPIGAYARLTELESVKKGEKAEKNAKKIKHNIILDVLYGNSSDQEIQTLSVAADDPKEAARRAAAGIRRKTAGLVTILGAGPGDENLLTKSGIDALKLADCIIFDRLASQKLLDLAPISCEKVYVGKENHVHTIPQNEINRLIVSKAMKNKNVIRLKGGDPFVFGRGGEEILYLKEHGIRYRVIPGISSALAGLLAAGIPVTHRGIAEGFRVVTAHDRSDRMPKIDFASMVNAKETCIFMMGLSNLDLIVSGLTEAGMRKDMPAAVVSNATLREQRCCVGTLSDIVDKVREEKLTSPAIIAVGEVVSLRGQIGPVYPEKSERPDCEERDGGQTGPVCLKKDDAQETKVEGQKRRRCLVTKTESPYRIGDRPESLEEYLRAYMTVDTVCTGKIAPITRRYAPQDLGDWDWIVFTGKNGVGAFFENLQAAGLDLRALHPAKIAAIGERTKQMLLQYSCQADLVDEDADSNSFSEKLKQNLNNNDRVLYVCNEAKEHPLEEKLRGFCDIQLHPVYVNEGIQKFPSDEELLKYDCMCFMNAQSVHRLFADRPSEILSAVSAQTAMYAIGPKCAKALEKYGFTDIRTAEKTSAESLAKRCAFS